MPRTTKTLAKTAPQPLAAPIVPPAEIDPETLEKALIGGDLGALSSAQRMQYMTAVCQSLSLNMLTRPLEFTVIDGKMLLYARKDCTEQLRRRDGIKIVIKERKTEDGIHSVTALASLPTGREDESIGAVPMVEPAFVVEWHATERGKKVRVDNPHKGKPLSADVRAKNMMLAETKAKRRVTLSIAGLGIPDESELEQQFEAATGPAPQAEAKKIEAEVVANGGTVTEIKPEVYTGAAPIIAATEEAVRKDMLAASDETAKLLDVECHIGNAGGPWLGKKVREIAPKALAVLCKDWLVKLPDKPLNKDARLRDAVLARKAIMDAAGEWPKDAPETPAKAPEAQTTTPEPQKGSKPAKNAKAEVSSETPFDWKEVVVPVEGKIKGKKLGELSDSHLLSSYVYGLPLLSMETEEEKAFYRGVREGMRERNFMTDITQRRQELFALCIAEIGVKSMTALNDRFDAIKSKRINDLEDIEIEAAMNDWDNFKEGLKP